MARRKAPRPKLMVVQRSELVHDRRAINPITGLLAAPQIVDDPFAPGERIVVLRALRDDPLAGLHAANQVTQAQYLAGRHLQRAYELAELGGARAIDPTKEAVDGGRHPQPTISDTQARAFGDVTKAHKALGMEGESIVMDVLGRHLTIAQTAAKRGMTGEAERKYIGRRFRECLDTISVLFGYATGVDNDRRRS